MAEDQQTDDQEREERNKAAQREYDEFRHAQPRRWRDRLYLWWHFSGWPW